MTAKRTASRQKKASNAGILLRYRDADTAYGVSRQTVTNLSQALGLNETQVIHVALAQFARQTLPQYAPDDGPLTAAQMKAIERLQPSGRMKVKDRLF